VRIDLAISILVPSSLLLLLAVGHRWPAPAFVADIMVVAGGAGLGLGALFFQDRVSMLSWLLTPGFAGVLTLVHVKVLSAAGGPLRR
jgi:hypothetical protein